MTHARHSRMRSAVLAIAALLAALALLPSAAAAKEAPPGAWYGWGAKFRVENGAPVVTFITYVAEDGTPVRFLAEKETRALDCVEHGQRQHHLRRRGRHGGVRRRLVPRVRPPVVGGGDQRDRLRPARHGRVHGLRHGRRPDLGRHGGHAGARGLGNDADHRRERGAGIRLSVESTGVTARSRLDVDRVLGTTSINTYRSSTWDIATSPLARTVVGMEGDGIVAVATTSTGWLPHRQLAAVVQVRGRGRAGRRLGGGGPPAAEGRS